MKTVLGALAVFVSIVLATDATIAGAVGGPRLGSDVQGDGGRATCTVEFGAGELAEVRVQSRGGRHLRVLVYSVEGDLVAVGDSVYSIQSVARWVPSCTGEFTIVVEAQGGATTDCWITTN